MCTRYWCVYNIFWWLDLVWFSDFKMWDWINQSINRMNPALKLLALILFSMWKKIVDICSLVHSRVEPNTRDFPKKSKIEWLSSNISRTTTMTTTSQRIYHIYIKNRIWITHESWSYDPPFIWNSAFRISQSEILIHVRDSRAILLKGSPPLTSLVCRGNPIPTSDQPWMVAWGFQ